MRQKLTAAHWGTYEIKQDGEDLSLMPLLRDPHPSEIGKGWVSAAKNVETRVARPSIREGWLKGRDKDRNGDARFVELPWDEALDIVGDELTRVIETHGNNGIFAGSYGWASAGRFHHAQSQLRRFLNSIGGYVGAKDTYSHAGAEVLWPHVLGKSNRVFQDEMTSWPLVAKHCDLLVSFGGISKRAAQVAGAGTSMHETHDWLARLSANGGKIVNVSPLKSDMHAGFIDQWIAPRPGTDCALILALAYEIFSEGHADEAFLERCTNGSEVFRTYVMGQLDQVPKTPEWAAQICDIDADDIRTLAQRMGTSRTMISMSWSMQRADRGEFTIWAGMALACLLGQIGKPGTGFSFGYGSSEPVGRPKKLIDWPSLAQGTNPVTDFIPVARIADMLENPGGLFAYDGAEYTYPDAKLIWWSGGNPFHHHQDLARLDRAWRAPETVIVMDHSWTATARRADIVLPTTTSLERDDIMINRRDTALVYMSAAMPVLGDAKNDHDILAGLALRIGSVETFTEGRSSEEWLAQIWEECRDTAKANGFSLPDFATFKEVGIFDVPASDEARICFESFVSDPVANPLGTRSGRLEISSAAIAEMALEGCAGLPQWHAPVEWLGAAEPDQLHLISGQPNTRLHAQNDSGTASLASKTEGRETCWIHPDVAKAQGLRAGDIALIKSDRGACLAGVAISDQMRADCVSLPTGAWLDLREIDGQAICVHGNPNMLTIDKGSSALSQGNISHTALVRISKWTAPLPDIRVHSQPRFVAQ